MAFVTAALLLLMPGVAKPVIDGDWWTVAGNPDLGALGTDVQQPVDFAVWKAKDGAWQLWSCIRGTKDHDLGRLLYRWEGKRLTDPDWTPKGIAMRGDLAYGERPGGLQAPHVVHWKGKYRMIYGCWDSLCLAISEDGKEFVRWKGADGNPQVFGEALGSNPRDAVSVLGRGVWYTYYTAFPDQLGKTYVRTTKDFEHWSDSQVAAFGGEAGTNIWSSECPHVVKLGPNQWYLFRTQRYGPDAITRVYFSTNPLDFGVDNDAEHLVCSLPICAPELLKVGRQWYIAALRPDYKGIRIAKLRWERP